MYKETLKLLLPVFIQSLIKNILRMVFPKDSIGIRSVDFTKKHSSVIVLGNGPSLKDDFEKIIEKSPDYDFVCVNNFCDSPYYDVLKPVMYVFLDAYFFSDNAHVDWVQQRQKTFSLIEKKTSWPMKIFLPFGADDSILKEIIKRPNVQIIKLNVYGVETKSCTKVTQFLFNTGYFGPPQVNVLIYAIFLSVWARYKNIEIYGADLSFHKDVDVDQLENVLYIQYRHFNNEDKIEELRKNPEKKEKWTMPELMELTAVTFGAHKVINEYSEVKSTNIYNLSSYSLIDAYRRKP